MSTRATEGYAALTEREKQTLRLIVRGHDAKSIARALDLSVHTVNERLRDARRKMAVSSSREAARMLLETESPKSPDLKSPEPASPGPDFSGDVKIGEAATSPEVEKAITPIPGVGRPERLVRITIGVALMTLISGFLALAALPQLASTSPQSPPAAGEATNAAVVEAARRWLVLVDQGRWDESYRATGEPFRKLNTSRMWASASQRVRTPLGAMISRVLISQDDVPAPPNGYQLVKFRTRFANKADAVETVTVDREDGVWRVVGVTIG